jgi:hypothetical protein
MTLLVHVASLGCRIKGQSLITKQESSMASWLAFERADCLWGVLRRRNADNRASTKVILNSSFRSGTHGRN